MKRSEINKVIKDMEDLIKIINFLCHHLPAGV